MKNWNPLRIACAVGAVVAGGLGFVFPPAAPIATKVAVFLAGCVVKVHKDTPAE